MMRKSKMGIGAAFVLAAAFAAAATAHAAATSTQPGRIAKAVAKTKGTPIDHTMEIRTVRGYKELVMGWTGATRGPGAGKAYAFLTESGGMPRWWLIQSARMTKELTAPAKRTLAAYLRRNKLPTGKIEFGDHVTAGRGGELLQRPFGRESGHLRFTVTEANGHQTRYLVPMNIDELIRGRRNPDLFGTPFKDLDTYGQHP